MTSGNYNQNPFSNIGRGIGSGILAKIKRHMTPIIIGVVVLAAVFFITIGASLPDDGEPIAVSGDAAISLANKIKTSVGDAPGTKTVTISVTDQEVTSFLAIASLLSGQIQQQGGSGNLNQIDILGSSSEADVASWQDLINSQGGFGSILTKGIELGVTIKDPEVRFTGEGAIIVRGYGKIGPLSVPARAVVVPRIVDGALELEIIEGQLGRLPLPGGMSNLVADGIEKALLAGRNVATVSQLDVSNGVVVFTGTVR